MLLVRILCNLKDPKYSRISIFFSVIEFLDVSTPIQVIVDTMVLLFDAGLIVAVSNVTYKSELQSAKFRFISFSPRNMEDA